MFYCQECGLHLSDIEDVEGDERDFDVCPCGGQWVIDVDNSEGGE